MKTRPSIIIGALWCVLCAAGWLAGCAAGPGTPFHSSPETPPLGEIVAVEGPDVTVDNRPARVGMPIDASQEVRTGARSEVTIRFQNGSVLHVFENTDPVFDIIREPWCLLIRMFYGKAMLDTNNACVRTETPESNAFIDSVILIQIEQGRTRYQVFQGKIRVAARDVPAVQKPVDAGQGIDVMAARVLPIRMLTPQQRRDLQRRYAKLVFPMPEWLGRPVKEVEAEAQKRGLQFDMRETRSGRAKPGTVIKQDPRPGTPIRRGDRVRLVVEAAAQPPYFLPSFEGRPLKEVTAELRRQKLRWEIKTIPSNRHRPGTVLEQNPPPKSKMRPGDTVLLVVTAKAAPQLIELPNLEGRTLDAALAELKTQGLRWEIENVRTRKAKPGTIAGQNPRPGTRVAPGQTIRLALETEAPPPNLIKLPLFEGRSIEAVQTELRKLGLRVKVANVKTNRVKPGIVVRQEPKAGTAVRRGHTVQLTVEGANVIKPPSNLQLY